MTVKANQPQLLHDIQRLLARAGAGAGADNPFRPAQVRALSEAVSWNVSQAQSFGLAHGRVERRILRVLEVPARQMEMWPCVQQVFEVQRRISHKKNGKTSCEVVCGVTSLPRAKRRCRHALGTIARSLGHRKPLALDPRCAVAGRPVPRSHRKPASGVTLLRQPRFASPETD